MSTNEIIACGALNQYSSEANKHAELYYETIRNDKFDCFRIARNTKRSENQILLIKNYLFIDRHYINIDDKLEYIRFKPDFMIACSWQRLSSHYPESIKEHDLILLEHENLEITYILEGYSQFDAHLKANSLANYQKACCEYYKTLKIRPEKSKRISFKRYHHFY